MTKQRDLERTLDLWFADGPSAAPDRIIDAVADRIERQSQRPAWRLDRRLHTMNTYPKLAAAIAAVIIVLAGGLVILGPGSSNIGGPTTTPTPAPTGTPSPALSTIAMPEGVMHAGTYVTKPFPYDPVRVTITVPEGWRGFGGWAVIGPSGTESPDGIGLGFVTVSGLVADPCRPAQASASPSPAVQVGPTVDDLVAALVAHGGYSVSAPTDTVISGYRGKGLDLQLPADLSGCSTNPSNYSIWEEDGGPSLFAQGPSNRWHLEIVDVNGLRLMVVTTSYAGTPAADRAQAQAMVDSIVLDRPGSEVPAPSPSQP